VLPIEIEIVITDSLISTFIPPN